MSDFPSRSPQHHTTLTPGSSASVLGDAMSMINSSTSVSAVWPSASLAIFIPHLIAVPSTAYQLTHENGTAVSGNVDVGLYDDNGNRLVSRGGVAQSGVSAIQAHDTTDLVLKPGLYYAAMVLDNIVGTVMRAGTPVFISRMSGVMSMAAAYPLPATATFAAMTQAYIPDLSVHLVSVA